MKAFKPTFLYVKTHLKTGLKYFGKTSRTDPYKYLGSGLYWLRHCRKHGKAVSTRIVGYYTDEVQCKKAAERFSKRHNIVNAEGPDGKKLWANCIPETGTDGGMTRVGYRHTKATRKKISESRIGFKHSQETIEKFSKSLTGRTLSDSHRSRLKAAMNRPAVRKKLRAAQLGRVLSKETREKMSLTRKGRKHTEETKAKMRGRKVSKATKEKMSQAQKGKVVTQDQRERISAALKGREVPSEVKEKLAGFVVAVDKKGIIKKIPSEEFYSQLRDHPHYEKSRYVGHRSKEARRRRGLD
jgi:hypothetical protein